MAINIQSIIDTATTYILQNLLEDNCKIYSTIRTNDGSGGYTETKGSYKTYNGLENIPCRLNQINARPQDMNDYLQEMTPATYYIDLPTDFPLAPDDKIEHGGLTYDIRTMLDDSTWRATKRAYLVVVR